MPTFCEELFKLVNKYYKDNNHEVYIDIIAELIEKNRKIEGLMVEDIITCMKKYNQSENIQRYGLQMLGNLTFNHLDNKKKVCDKDGINLVFDCIKKFPDNIDIQIYGLRLLGILTYDYLDNIKKVCDKDGINLIIDCIKKFPDNTCIQIFGLYFLINLVYYKSYNKDLVYDNIKKISNKDGIQLVLNTMKKFSDNQIIQRYGILLLVILACNNYSDNKKKIAVKNNIELISNLLLNKYNPETM